MSGFIVMQREALDHPLLKDGERFRAWFWMLARAAWKPTPFDIGGKVITLQRGQLCGSVRQFADAWGMSKSAVDRFLSRLETETMIKTETGHGRSVITICNYAKYQDVEKDDRDSSGTPTGTAAGQQRDIKEQGNQGTIEEEAKASPSKARGKTKFVRPDWVPSAEWSAFVEMRRTIRKPMTDRAMELAVGELRKLAEDGHPPGAVLDQSTAASWQGLFPLKDQQNGRHGNNRNGASGHHGGRDNRDGFKLACDDWIDEIERSATGEAGRGGQLALGGPDTL